MSCLKVGKLCLEYGSYKVRLGSVDDEQDSLLKEIVIKSLGSFLECEKSFLSCKIG